MCGKNILSPKNLPNNFAYNKNNNYEKYSMAKPATCFCYSELKIILCSLIHRIIIKL